MRDNNMFVAKWYNIDIPYFTHEMMRRVDTFRSWLYDAGIKFETSGNFDMVHFEIFVKSQNEHDNINNALDGLVFFDAIRGI